MCHCFTPIEELSESEREAIKSEHSLEELRAEYSEAELATLGVTA